MNELTNLRNNSVVWSWIEGEHFECSLLAFLSPFSLFAYSVACVPFCTFSWKSLKLHYLLMWERNGLSPVGKQFNLLFFLSKYSARKTPKYSNFATSSMDLFMCLHFKILFWILTKVHETDTWIFSASLGAHIHKEEQKINVKISTCLITKMAAESLISAWPALRWIQVRK